MRFYWYIPEELKAIFIDMQDRIFLQCGLLKSFTLILQILTYGSKQKETISYFYRSISKLRKPLTKPLKVASGTNYIKVGNCLKNRYNFMRAR